MESSDQAKQTLESQSENKNIDVKSDKESSGISKRQLKKQAKQEKWLEKRATKRDNEKKKNKKSHGCYAHLQRFNRANQLSEEQQVFKLNADGDDIREDKLGEEIKEEFKDGDQEVKKTSKKEKQQMFRELCQRGPKYIIDCEFESLMQERELKSLAQQLAYCHSVNKRIEQPLNIMISGVEEKLQTMIQKSNCQHWAVDIRFKEKYIDICAADKDKLIYLSADSENLIEKLDDSMTYIVGGIVDHNRYKLLTFKKANEQGIKHARLPIRENIELTTSAVLTVNHVFEIISAYYKHNGDWKKALHEAIPERKRKDVSQADKTIINNMRKAAQNIVLSGIQPSGFIHLGNYLGAVQNWVQLQDDPKIHQRFYSVVDYHSLTQKYVGLNDSEDKAQKDDEAKPRQESPQELTLKTAATLLACGIDPKKSSLFVQSHIAAIPEMTWFFSCLTPQSWLNRMIQYKEKKGDKSDKHTSLSIFSYPVLMAADILAFKANLVPVGEDQTQHLELAKDIAERFNKLFAEDQDDPMAEPIEDLFPLPKKLSFAESHYVYNRVMSLQDASKKMSKSDKSLKSCINLIDDPEVIRIKIQKSKTDSLGRIKYDLNRPELANLLHIYAALEGVDVKKIDLLFEDDNMFAFKQKLSNKLIDKICPIGEKTLDLCTNSEDQLLEILDKGAKEANKRAEETLIELKERAGILRRGF